MIVSWDKPKAGIKVIDIPNESGKTEKSIYFVPGPNEIAAEDWEKARTNDQIKEQIEKGYFKEYGIEKEVAVKDKSGKETDKKEKRVVDTPLSKIEAKEAVKIVADTANLSTLKKWQKEEGRDEVRAAIANQIEFVDNGGKKKGE